MNKRILALFVFILVLLALTGCAQADVVWEEDFSSTSHWKTDDDGHVFCSEIPVLPQDMIFSSVEVDTPAGDNSAAVLVANPQSKEGLFVNGIAHREFELQDQSTYVLTGLTAPVADTQIEIMDASIEVVVDGVGHYGELLYRLNPYMVTPLPGDVATYGWIYTRQGVKYEPVMLYNAGDERIWHSFAIQISVDSTAGVFLIDRVGFDGRTFLVDVEMPSEAKPAGYADVAQVFLETHNMNTNCDTANVFRGASLWDDLTLVRYPLGQAPEELRMPVP